MSWLKRKEKSLDGNSWSSKDIKCDKILPNGKVCGKPLGSCIHTWITVRWGKKEK